MQTEPLISIIITSFNYGQYIKDAINSCLEQDYKNLEIIVVDDGSSDNTHSILEEYSSRIKIFKNKNQGLEISANFGINVSIGDYWVRLDADDYFDKNYVSEIVKEIDPNYSFFYTDYKIINENNEIVETFNLPAFNKKEILKRGDFLATGTLVNKKLSLEIGLYNRNEYNCGLENYEFIIKLILNNNKGKHIKKNLWNYRHHHESLSYKKQKAIVKYGNNLFKRYSLGSFVTNENHPYKLKI
mgnify:CR=1 FL=1